MKRELTYKEKFEIMDREALATLICAILVTIFFWGAIFLLKDNPTQYLLSMPLWFTVSCIGGYLVSVIGVIFIVKRYFVDFSLDDDKDSNND